MELEIARAERTGGRMSRDATLIAALPAENGSPDGVGGSTAQIVDISTVCGENCVSTFCSGVMVWISISREETADDR